MWKPNRQIFLFSDARTGQVVDADNLQPARPRFSGREWLGGEWLRGKTSPDDSNECYRRSAHAARLPNELVRRSVIRRCCGALITGRLEVAQRFAAFALDVARLIKGRDIRVYRSVGRIAPLRLRCPSAGLPLWPVRVGFAAAECAGALMPFRCPRRRSANAGSDEVEE